MSLLVSPCRVCLQLLSRKCSKLPYTAQLSWHGRSNACIIKETLNIHLDPTRLRVNVKTLLRSSSCRFSILGATSEKITYDKYTAKTQCRCFNFSYFSGDQRMSAQVPPLVRPSDKDFADSSSRELHVQPHYVETTRSRFLDVTDGDLLKYCTGMGWVCLRRCLVWSLSVVLGGGQRLTRHTTLVFYVNIFTWCRCTSRGVCGGYNSYLQPWTGHM